MDYLKFSFPISKQPEREVVLASLIGFGFDGFEEDDAFLYAYIPYSEDIIGVAVRFGQETGIDNVRYERIPSQNWNARWESEFSPVVVAGFCTVRAGFHNMEVATPYEIVITPKMAFGTGHHDTTRLMIAQMQHIPFAGKTVLDFGTGTGILAILAAQLGAEAVDAVDNDDWAFDNAQENVRANQCTQITVLHGTLEAATARTYDVILANINRHILLETMTTLSQKLAADGRLLMSGLLLEDADVILEAADKVGFVLRDRQAGSNWMLLEFGKE